MPLYQKLRIASELDEHYEQLIDESNPCFDEKYPSENMGYVYTWNTDFQKFFELLKSTEPIQSNCIKCKKNTTHKLQETKIGINLPQKPYEVYIMSIQEDRHLDVLAEQGQLNDLPQLIESRKITDHLIGQVFTKISTCCCCGTFGYSIFHINSSNKCYTFCKIGEFPSIRDIHKVEMIQYESCGKKLKNIIRDHYFRALEFHHHGLGIASFVEGRRTIEGLIQLKIDKSKNKNLSLRNQKINIIIDALNETSEEKIQNSLKSAYIQLYKHFSAGIHTGSDKECQEKFPLLWKGLEYLIKVEMNAITTKEAEISYQNAINKIINSSQ